MRVDLGDVNLWFDVSGPSVAPDGAGVIERPTLVAVHGGPGADHINLKDALAPLAEHVQILFYDQRGHGRSDHSSPEFWNQRTWATDLRRLCDTLGLHRPVVLGSSFGGRVTLAYAGLFPGHARGIILANTTGGRVDDLLSIEIFRRLGGAEAAAAAERDFAENSAGSRAEFRRVCGPLYTSRPWSSEELRQQRSPVDPDTGRQPALLPGRGPAVQPLEPAGPGDQPGAHPRGRRRPRMPVPRRGGAGQPASGEHHHTRAPARCPARHLPRPARPGLPGHRRVHPPHHQKRRLIKVRQPARWSCGPGR